MSTLRDLVAGQGCDSSGGGPNKNPLASLFDSLLHKNQKAGQDGMLRAPSGVPGVPNTQMDRSKIRNRATVVTRHMFPDAPPQFLEEQVAVFMNVLEISAVEGPSLADDLRYQEFLAAGARPALPVRPAGEMAGPSSSSWADDFQRQRSSTAPAGPHPGAAWADDFMARLHLEETIPRFAPQGQSGPSWVHEFDVHIRQGPLPGPEALGGGWAAEFSGLPRDGEGAGASSWAEQFAEAQSGAAWANEFEAEADAALTPEQKKAAKGPSPDDPLEDPNAPSWVRQFNEELGQPTTNQETGDVAKLEKEMGLTPREENPYSHEGNPLGMAWELMKARRLGDAALALEAACRAQPGNLQAWLLLGRIRLELEAPAAAIMPLRRSLTLGPVMEEAARLLAEAAVAAGQRSVALGALGRWTDLRGGLREGVAALDSPPPVDEIAARLEELCRQHPGDAKAWLMAGLLRTLRGDHEGAAESFGYGVRACRDDPACLLHLGGALLKAGKLQVAERCFAAAGSQDPARAPAWGGLGRCLAAQGNFTGAAEAYTRALKARPDSSALWDSLAIAAVAAGRPVWATAAEKRDMAALDFIQSQLVQ